jgi:hypothetical protein
VGNDRKMKKYQLDFEKIKQFSGGRITPRFPRGELEKCTLHTENDSIYENAFVKKYKQSKAMEEFMPMTNMKVVEWLKELEFTSNPEMRFKVSLLPVGKLIPESDENTAS